SVGERNENRKVSAKHIPWPYRALLFFPRTFRDELGSRGHQDLGSNRIGLRVEVLLEVAADARLELGRAISRPTEQEVPVRNAREERRSEILLEVLAQLGNQDACRVVAILCTKRDEAVGPFTPLYFDSLGSLLQILHRLFVDAIDGLLPLVYLVLRYVAIRVLAVEHDRNTSVLV